MEPLNEEVPGEAGGKWCERCRKYLTFSHYHRNKRTPDGYQLWCKACQKEYRRRGLSMREERHQELQRFLATRRSGRPSLLDHQKMDEIAKEMQQLEMEEGLSRKQIADAYDVSISQVDKYLARARKMAFDGDSREEMRHWAILHYEDIYEKAMRKGDLSTASAQITKILQSVGIVSTGGNTLNVGITGGGNKFEALAEKLLEDRQAIEGEVVDDAPAAPEDPGDVRDVPPGEK